MSFVTETRKNKNYYLISLTAHYQIFGNHVVILHGNSVFSLMWPASMQIYWNKRKHLHKKRVKLPQDWFGTGFGGWKLQMPHSGARWFTPKPYVGTEKKCAQDNTKIAFSSKSAENAIFIGNLQ